MAGRLDVLTGDRYLTINLWFIRLDFTFGFSYRKSPEFIYFEKDGLFFYDFAGYYYRWLERFDKPWIKDSKDAFAFGPCISLEHCKNNVNMWAAKGNYKKIWKKVPDPCYPLPPLQRPGSIG